MILVSISSSNPDFLFFPNFNSDSTLKNVTTDFKRMGKRIFVFIIGGATRSEVEYDKKKNWLNYTFSLLGIVIMWFWSF